jgi:glycine betaine/proline transport system substrate-binding protein
MKKLFASTVFAASMFALSGAANAAECGTVTIANMNWQSAEVLAAIDSIILKEGYGCETEIVAGDTIPTFTSMNEKGQPDFASEMWINAVREPLDAAVAEGKLTLIGQPLKDGAGESWFIPKFIADAHPEIKTVADALARPDLFPAPEDASKGAVYNCPAGWGCQISTGNLFRAFKGEEKGFVLVDTGSGAGLDGSIAKANESKTGWLGYYWYPTSLLNNYEMVALSNGVEHDKAMWDGCIMKGAECADPQPTNWPKTEVYTVAVADLAQRSPIVAEYLGKRAVSGSEIQGLMAWMTENQATGEDGAKHFLKTNPDVWSAWVSAEAAEKIKAAVN